MVQIIIQLAKTLLISYTATKVIKIIAEKVGCDEEFVRKILNEYRLI